MPTFARLSSSLVMQFSGMKPTHILFLLFIGLLPLFSWARFADAATAVESSNPRLLVLEKAEGVTPLVNGVEVHSAGTAVQITALRDDILRVRVTPPGETPENGSWAVLSEARSHQVPVVAESNAATAGFSTRTLRVRLDKATMRLQILTLDGAVVQEDVPGRPIEFHGKAFSVYKTMPPDEHYFGLGDKPGALDRRGQAYTLWNTDAYAFQESTDPIYKSIPFFLAVRPGLASGVLFDNTWRTHFNFGKETPAAYSFGSEGGSLDYYVMYGPDAKQVLSSYAWLTGPAPLPPLWAFGFQQSRFSYFPESRVKEIADRLRVDKIPVDAIYLDIDYQDRHRPFTVDAEKFPTFTQMIAGLAQQHIHVVAITDLHIAMLPNANYAPYDSGIAGDHFVKNPDGSIYVGRVWPGPSVFPDFTQKASRDWWGTLYTQFVKDGVSGFWNDMNEPSIFDSSTKTMPEDVVHRIDEPGFRKRTASHSEIHDVYGMENSRGTYEGLLAISPNQRPFVLTRASYAGGQRYATTWTGDNSSTWNHLRLTTPMILNLGLSGFGMTGADVGGFIGSPSPELLTKWFELGAFQPIDRDHASDTSANQEIWVNGPEQEAIRKHYIEERYRLLPYLYTAAEEMSRTGIPILRPLFLEFPNATPDKHPIDIDTGNEFLFGRDFLIAPPVYPEKPDNYLVSLPVVGWYNYWTGEKIATQVSQNSSVDQNAPVLLGQQISVKPELEVLPIFVREGSIVPLQPLTQNTSETPQGPLTLRVYPGKNCQGAMYLDDGVSFNYRHGDYLRMEFSCRQTADGLAIHISEHQGTFHPWWTNLQIEIYGSQTKPSSVRTSSEKKALESSFDSTRHAAIVTIPDTGTGVDLQIEWPRE